MDNTKDLYLSGGFKDEHKTEMGTQDVPLLQSNHEEVDSRILLHAIFSAASLGTEPIVVYANDTDVIIMCIYYTNRFESIKEMWVKTEAGSYLPIHKIVKALGDKECCVLPFLHALSGKDDTSFIYNLGKKVMWKAHKSVDCTLLAEYADNLPE